MESSIGGCVSRKGFFVIFVVAGVSVYCLYYYFLLASGFNVFPKFGELFRDSTEEQSQKPTKTPEDSTKRLTLLFSSWRFGATFLAELLSSPKNSFYFYEPLEFLGTNLADERAAAEILKIHECNFTQTKTKLWHRNSFLEDLQDNGLYVDTPDPLEVEQRCLDYPRQVIKIIRKDSELMERILAAVEDAEVKGLYLIRDPRATWNSRKYMIWCTGVPACGEPAEMCAGMVRNYYQAQELMQKYPGQFTVLRFEDLASRIQEETEALFHFLGLNFGNVTKEYIAAHNTADEGDEYSTYKYSLGAVSWWLNDLSFDDVIRVQDVCSEAMELWGYNMLENAKQLEDDDFEFFGSYKI